MTRPSIVPAEILARLRSLCLELPESHEEAAWTGTRWMIGKKNFAHVVQIDAGWPPAYAKAASSDGPLTVLTFRVPIASADAARFQRAPFFRPPWFANIVGLAIDHASDWDAIADFVNASWRQLAPKRLHALVDPP
jgi:hypothetical protein